MRSLYQILLLAPMALFFGCASPAGGNAPVQAVTIPVGGVLLGRLGTPIGELVTIAGVKLEQGRKIFSGDMKVETINGQPAPDGVFVLINNVDLPENQRCVIQGYETIATIGTPPAYEELARQDHLPPPPMPQAGWSVDYYFVPLKVISPASLQINKAE